MEGALGLLHKLFGTTPEDDGARLALGKAAEQVEAFASDLFLLEITALSESGIVEVVHRRLDGAAAGLHRAVEVLFGDAARAEHVSVGEVLRRDVSDGQTREDDLGAGFVDLVQLVVEDVPLGVDDLLVFFDVVQSDLGVVLLRFELQLDVEEGDFRFLVGLGLHLETGVGEGLLEGHSLL